MNKGTVILKSKNIFTAKDDKCISGAIVVKDEKIHKVVKDISELENYIDEGTEVIDCGERLIMPGIIDAHLHLDCASILNSPNSVQIEGAKSEAEVVERVVEFRKNHPDFEFIYGFGWLNTAWDDTTMPTRHSLDKEISDIPVYLQSLDGHSFWTNTKALEVCGVTKDSTANFGGYGKDEDGELTGIIYDVEATTPFTMNSNNFPKEIIKEMTLSMLKEFNKVGITSVGDMAATTYPIGEYNDYAAYDELNSELEGGLPVRLFLYPSLGSTGDFEIVNSLRERYQGEKVQIAGLKQLLDGVVVTHTAYTLEPYADDPSTCGELFYDKATLMPVVKKANEQGYSVRLHAISDGSARVGLDIFEESQKYAKGHKIVNTLEHIDNLDLADIKRFGELGVIPSMQPRHMSLTNTYLVKNLGEERAKLAYTHKSLIEAGASLAFGTDVPCVPYNPFETIYFALTRCDFDGTPLTNNPEEAIGLADALRAYTYGSACAVNSEEKLGTLEEGKFADILVCDGPMFGEDPLTISKRRSFITMNAGKIVYKAE